jgi:ABC-type multidrug transport system ATPase subunit
MSKTDCISDRIVEIQRVTKKFGKEKVTAVNSLSLDVHRG